MASKHVEDGVLLKSSPTDIQSHDPATTFGCSRRWWYKRVAGIPEAESEAMRLGTAFHAMVENKLDHARKAPTMTPQLQRMWNSCAHVVDTVRPRIIAIERKCELLLNGVQINGRVDIVTKDGILDWKTSSNAQKYGKTSANLRVDTQMLLYAEWAAQKGYSWKLLEHVTVPKDGKETLHTKATIAETDRKAGVQLASSQLELMKATAKKKDPVDVEPNRNACFTCSYKPQCPKGSTSIMSILNRFASSAAPVPVLPPVPEGVVPPDAPKSTLGRNGAVQIVDIPAPDETPPLPVETVLAPAPPPLPPPAAGDIVPSKRGRGRPRKETASPATPAVDERMALLDEASKHWLSAPAPAAPVVAVAAYSIRKVRVAYGFKAGLPNYSSVSAEVEFEADVEEGKHVKAIEELTLMAKAEVSAQIKKQLEASTP